MSAPLEDIVVVDLTRALSGPQAAMMLGDLGARVVKVEAPGHGDDSRGWGPPFVRPGKSGPGESGPSESGPGESGEGTGDGEGEGDGEGGDREAGDISTYFLCCNRNKESITLDLKSPAGAATLARLVARADVLLENFRPGTLDRLGFPVARLHALNPRLVIGSISGFGHDGPEGGRPGYDQIAQGEAGLMSVTGPDPQHPQRVGVPIADLLSGMNLAYGVVAALRERDRTGRGRVVRTSLLASVVGVHALHGTAYTVAGHVGRAQGNHHPAIAPYGLFRCRDGQVQVAIAAESQWRRFAAEFGIDARASGLATNGDRVRGRAGTIAAVEAAFADLDAGPLLERLAALGIPAGRVRAIDEVYGWDQVASQGLLVELEHPALGPITVPGPAIRFDDLPYAGGRAQHLPPPALGEHTDAILAWLHE